MKKLTVIVVLGLFACGQSSEKKEQDKKLDTISVKQDLQTNNTNTQTSIASIKIGTQLWATKNLDVSTFRNGDTIPEAKTAKEWKKAAQEKKPSWCYYENDPVKGAKFGKLYNWFAVNDPRILAPIGWHVPSNEEWTKLTDELGGIKTAGTKMKAANEWKDNGNNNRNESHFGALPGGYRNFDGKFGYMGDSGYWWTSTEENSGTAWFRYMDNIFANGHGVGCCYGEDKRLGFSIRCLKD